MKINRDLAVSRTVQSAGVSSTSPQTAESYREFIRRKVTLAKDHGVPVDPGETVLDPFSGIGTVPMCAVELGRKAIGIELCQSYFIDGATYTEIAEQKLKSPSLLNFTEAEEKL